MTSAISENRIPYASEPLHAALFLGVPVSQVKGRSIPAFPASSLHRPWIRPCPQQSRAIFFAYDRRGSLCKGGEPTTETDLKRPLNCLSVCVDFLI